MSSVLCLPRLSVAISSLAAILFSVLTGLAGPAFAQAEVKPFYNAVVARDAKRYDDFIAKRNAKTALADWKLRKRAKAALDGGDARRAMDLYADATTVDRGDARNWIGLARSLMAVQKPVNNQELHNFRVNAGGAAFQAYQLAKTDRTRAEALAIIARSLRLRSYWRPSLNAYAASIALQDNPVVRQAYFSLRDEKGFRVLDYTVESDSAQPRVCIQFSERLSRDTKSFATYISVNGRDPATVRAEDRQICVDGLRHGERYQIKVRTGLPSDIKETLRKTAQLSVYVRDRSPSARFTGRNYVLPNKGQKGIPIVSVNTSSLELEVYRIGDRGLARAVLDGRFRQQMSSYDATELQNKLGERVWSGAMTVNSKLNKDVTTAIPIGDVIPTLKPGVYIVMARADGAKSQRWSEKATQWFVVSDLGLTAFTGRDGIHALVRSLDQATPVSDVRVELLARNGEVLATGSSDAQGHVKFDAGIANGAGGMSPALLIARKGEKDFVFLNLATSAFDLTDRGVAGRAVGGPLEAYVFTERGVYRPGAEVHITALLRDENSNAATGIPTTLVIDRPDGVEHRRLLLNDTGTDGGLGGHIHSLQLATTAMTGTWRARLYTDPKADPVGHVSFLVEDFVPERMAMTLTPESKSISTSERATIKLDGRYLYGPPAANLAVEGDISVQVSKRGRAGWLGYTFGLDDQKVNSVYAALGELPRTDEKGLATVPVTLPKIPETDRPLEARVKLRLREPGGRTIERSATLAIAAERPSVGIKPLFEADDLGPESTATFDVVALDATSRATSGTPLTWTLFRVERHFQWYSQNGSWRYEPVVYTRKASAGTLVSDASTPGRISVPVSWGRYRLEVSTQPTDGGDPIVSSFGFDAGWYSTGDADTPERLETSLDRKGYKPGDTARLTITSEDAGRAQIAILSDRMHLLKDVEVTAGQTTVSLDVDAAWAPGAYVTTLFYRPMDAGSKRMPRRAIGVQWLDLDRTHRTLGVALQTPAKVNSGSTLTVPIQLSGLKHQTKAHVVVAAVDVGILNLTRFAVPAPDDFFYAQRQLGVELRDLYGRLIDGMRADRGVVRSGGDGDGGGTQGSPPTGKPVALFSGLVTVDADGKANVAFDLPEFNGTLRVMAVAWSGTKVGHGSTDVIVRDPVAMLVSGPRFLTLGDSSRLQLDLHNVEGPADEYAVSVSRHSIGRAPQSVLNRTIRMTSGQRVFVNAPISAKDPGEVTYTVRLKGPKDIAVVRTLTFDVKVPGGAIRRRTVATLQPGQSLDVTPDLIDGLIPGLARVSVSVGQAAGFDVPGMMLALERYPYACAEQTTSRALPLLYLSSVAGRTQRLSSANIKDRIQKAIARLMELQGSNGAFGLWAPGSSDIWLTSYVTDFLTRAKEQGHNVPKRALGQSLDRLQNYVTYAGDFKNGGEAVAYALYVLARNGRAPIGDLRYYADTRLNNFATPLAKAQLGAALAMYGDTERAKTILNAASSSLQRKADDRWRADYGTNLRDTAGALTLVAETNVSDKHVPTLTSMVASALASNTYTSTQENAWVLLAARSIMDNDKRTRLSVDNKSVEGHFTKDFDASSLANGGPKVVNSGEHPVEAVVTVTGDSLTPEPQDAQGLTIKREYYALDGTPLNLASSTGGDSSLKQNDRMLVVVNVNEDVTRGGRFMLVDNLPAGLEIENPRLLEGGETDALSWLKTGVRATHTDFRKDRVMAAFNLPLHNNQAQARTMTVAYIVRAVSPGSFVHPAATAEDMYRPDRFARTAAGRLNIETVE